MPLFSIVTVCFNSERTLERTISSVLKQDFKDYEYIIIDGGSTDHTIDILKKYEPLFDGRMHWKSEPDKGIYDAFNKGIKQSRGIYVWIVNSDDYIEKDALVYLSHEVSRFDVMNLPIISGALRYFEEETNKEIFTEFLSSDMSETCYKRDTTCVVHPATLVPKQIYNEYGLYDDRFYIIADCDFFHRIHKDGQKIVFFNKIITNMSNGGVSGQWTLHRYKKSFYDRKLYYKKNYDKKIERYARFLIWNFHFLSIYIRQKCRAW